MESHSLPSRSRPEMKRAHPNAKVRGNAADDLLHALLVELDRLEELIEEMDDLQVMSRAEAESRMAELHQKVDEFDVV